MKLFKTNLMSVRLIILLSIFLEPFVLLSQSNQVDFSRRWFDDVIGQTNTGIFKGTAYSNEFRVINEQNQFYKESDFQTGSVTYSDQTYYDISLRYDVYNDQLLIRNESLSSEPIMVFDTKEVANFKIGKDAFEFIEAVSSRGDELFGFFEILLENDSLGLYKKNTKKLFKRTDEQRIYYEFVPKHFYLIKYKGHYFPLDKVKGMNKIFPEYSKSISISCRLHKELKKSNQDIYVLTVLKELFQEMSKAARENQ
ncbi:hypothetical protein NYZ99_00805 [Maribacter litopenaei]|uniref:Uncharacterized protein n=1 Tax=Maribacter litopenaei TaxID=2976127 RepID=A0ABY5Y8P4_9FLAO|nr:hypothetical protein [Maribacter litopenaei]UWX55206.1 hypothetical protein NYZ99_00805 [Maribacter litopenaei]